MTKEPNNQASENINEFSKHWFFAVEHTSATSPIDINEFCLLLGVICKRYNLKWCQAIWKDDIMQRLERHLSTFAEQKRHNNDFKKPCPMCKDMTTAPDE